MREYIPIEYEGTLEEFCEVINKFTAQNDDCVLYQMIEMEYDKGIYACLLERVTHRQVPHEQTTAHLYG